MPMQKAIKILHLLYTLIVLFFLLDSVTSFDIKKQFLKSPVYFGFLFGSPLVLLLNIFIIKVPVKKVIGIICPAIFCTIAAIMGPLHILRASGAWRTQTVLYAHRHLAFRTIEFQMQDIGGLGYQKRTVEVIYLTPLFAVSTKAPEDIDQKVEWIKVDKDVNELQLTFP